MPKYYLLQLIRKRLAWILMYERVKSVSKVSRHFGISRKCFYKWLRRKGLIKKAKRREKTTRCYQMPYPGYLQMDIKVIGGYRPGGFVQYSAQDDATRVKFTRLYPPQAETLYI